jgi:hypothetical protein
MRMRMAVLFMCFSCADYSKDGHTTNAWPKVRTQNETVKCQLSEMLKTAGNQLLKR